MTFTENPPPIVGKKMRFAACEYHNVHRAVGKAHSNARGQHAAHWLQKKIAAPGKECEA
jgi:hypothetical protein